MHVSAGLLPLCTGQQESVHPYVTCVYRNTGINDKKAYFDPPLDSTMIRDDRYKLIFYHAVPAAGVGLSMQLFDMAADPHEQHNLADDPELAAVQASCWPNWSTGCVSRLARSRAAAAKRCQAQPGPV